MVFLLTDSILTEEGSDIFGIEAAYTADSYGVSVAYADDEATTAWGVNGTTLLMRNIKCWC